MHGLVPRARGDGLDVTQVIIFHLIQLGDALDNDSVMSEGVKQRISLLKTQWRNVNEDKPRDK